MVHTNISNISLLNTAIVNTVVNSEAYTRVITLDFNSQGSKRDMTPT